MVGFFVCLFIRLGVWGIFHFHCAGNCDSVHWSVSFSVVTLYNCYAYSFSLLLFWFVCLVVVCLECCFFVLLCFVLNIYKDSFGVNSQVRRSERPFHSSLLHNGVSLL